MIPSELGNLVSLRLLEIQDNDLFGKLPLTMVNLSELNYLKFWRTGALRSRNAGISSVAGQCRQRIRRDLQSPEEHCFAHWSENWVYWREGG